MKQKVIKIGSSIGVVIPKPVAEELGFKAGQEINLRETDYNKIIIERLHHEAKPRGKNAELVAWAEAAVERYRPALEALKDK